MKACATRSASASRTMLAVFLSIVLVVGFTPITPPAHAAESDGGGAVALHAGDTQAEGSVGGIQAFTIDDGAASVDDESYEVELTLEGTTQAITPGGENNSDELFDAYVEQYLESQLPGAEQATSSSKRMRTQFADNLSERDQAFCSALELKIREVAEGNEDTAVFTLDMAETLGSAPSWTAGELGLTSISDDKEAAKNAAMAAMSIDSTTIMGRLLVELPYDLYWFDKTAGMMTGYVFSLNSSTIRITSVSFWFAVVDSYAKADGMYENGVAYSVDTSKMDSVKTAVATAEGIVDANAAKPLLERLTAYKDAICTDVDYNHDAARNENTPYGDPWQLIWVFDGDPNTTVVCEGYSKAFQYLCDLSKNLDATSRIATGVMAGGTGAGGHMWNIVEMPDGKNYLVDVTNCDTGSVGAPDQLFIAVPSSGNLTEYVFTCENGYSTSTIRYAYDDDTLNLYSDSELTLSATAYEPPEPVSIASADVTFATQTYTGQALEPAPSVTVDGDSLVPGTDFTVAYRNNINAGIATATITGRGNYTGQIEAAFTIEKASIAVPGAVAGLVYNGAAQQGVPAGDGYTLSGATATNAGSYTATAALDANHVWQDGSTDSKQISWSISQKAVQVKANNAGKVHGDADPVLTATVTGTIGNDTVSYELSRVGGEDAGSYAISATGAASQGNYSVTFLPGTFSIAQEAVTVPTAESFEYNGAEQEGVQAGTGYKLSGIAKAINAGNYVATATLDGNYVWSDNSTDAKELSWSIEPKPVTVKAEDKNKVYGAADPAFTATVTGTIGADTVSYELSRASGENAGSYAISATGAMRQGNYSVTFLPGTFTIEKASIAVPGAVAGLVYNGAAQQGVPAGDGYVLSGATATNAGTHTATASLDANHVWQDGTTGNKTIAFTIEKAANTVSAKAAKAQVAVTYDAAKAQLAGANVTVSGAQGKVAYKNVSVNATAAKFGVDASTGMVTVPKATPAGSYAVVLQAAAAGNANYSAAAKNVSFTITVGKAANPLAAKANKASLAITYSAVKTQATAANVTVSGAQGAVRYANASANATAKKFTVNASTGKVTVPKGTPAGTYAVQVSATAAGNANYSAVTKTVSYKITVNQAANLMVAKAKSRSITVKLAKVKKANVPLAAKKVFSVTKAQGKVAYKKTKGNAKIVVAKNGKLTVKKGLKKGSYSVKVKVSAAGAKNYKAATKTITLKVVVK